MIKLLWCSCIFMIWKIGYFHRTEQNRTKQKSKSKPKQAKKLRKGLGQRLDVTPKEAARAPGSTFQKVAFWRPTRVR